MHSLWWATCLLLLVACSGPKDLSSDRPPAATNRTPLQKPVPPRSYTCYLNEPFWKIEVDPEQGIILEQIGEARLVFPYTAPIKEVGSLSYITKTENHQLKVTVRGLSCTDSMSGKGFSHSVEVTFNDRSHTGCAERTH